MICLAPASGLHAVTFQLAVKRGDADAQQAGGFGLVAFRVFEYPEDVVPFEGVERHRVGHGAVARRGMEFGGEAAAGVGLAVAVTWGAAAGLAHAAIPATNADSKNNIIIRCFMLAPF